MKAWLYHFNKYQYAAMIFWRNQNSVVVAVGVSRNQKAALPVWRGGELIRPINFIKPKLSAKPQYLKNINSLHCCFTGTYQACRRAFC